MLLQDTMQGAQSALSSGADFAAMLISKAYNNTDTPKPRDSLTRAVQSTMAVSMDALLQDSLKQMQQWLNINDLQVQASDAAQGGKNGTP